MSGQREILLDRPLCGRIDRHKADLRALSFDAKMHDSLAAVEVFDPEPAELFPTDPVIQQGRENRAVAHALELISRRRFQQFAYLPVAKRRRAAFVCRWPLAA